ncbi:MAG: ABC transporter ATP-binding protein/permease [Bacilli bacterium]|nr:ABC transporter ATP-binding protein/permease [Bacilli bacterium]
MGEPTDLISGIKFIFSYIKKYWFALIVVVILILVATYVQVLAPQIMADAINQMTDYLKTYLMKGDYQAKYDIFFGSIVKMLIAYGLIALSSFFYSYMMAGVASNSSAKIRSSLFNKLQKLSIRFFDASNEGDILSRFTNDIDNITMLLNQAFVQIISSIALVVAITVQMFSDNVKLAAIVVLLAVFNIILVLLITNKAKNYVDKQQEKLGLLNGYIDEKITGQKLIITTGTEDETYNEFIPFNEDYRKTSQKGQALSNILFPLVNGIMLVSIGCIVFFGADQIKSGALSVGLLVAFITYAQRFFQPITQIVSQYSVFRLALTGAGRAKEVLDVKEDVVDSEKTIEFQPIKKEVQLKNVNFSYKKGEPILKNVNISLWKGRKIALVGPTGSGKTTIMNLLNRFYDVDSGDILFDGVSIKDISLTSLRKNVGIVLQDNILFGGTIKENIAYGNEDASQDEIEAAAKAASIHDYIMSLEKGYDTLVDNSNSIFSVGQKQLICIARTILTNPELLILDEATSNVDTVTEAQIQIAINNVLVNRTSFVIAHRLKTIIDADHIVVLKDGEVIEQGNHEQLLALNGFYAELYTNQFVPSANS